MSHAELIVLLDNFGKSRLKVLKLCLFVEFLFKLWLKTRNNDSWMNLRKGCFECELDPATQCSLCSLVFWQPWPTREGGFNNMIKDKIVNKLYLYHLFLALPISSNYFCTYLFYVLDRLWVFYLAWEMRTAPPYDV